MSLFDAAGQLHVPAQAREVFDVTGAGDTVIATLAAMVAAGLTLRDAMPIANRAGGIVVGKFGTASVTYEELFAMTRVVVTGAAGMIGSNLVHGLNAIGIDDIIAVDDLTRRRRSTATCSARASPTTSTRDEFYDRFARGELGTVDAVFHEGACSDTMEHDGRYMLDNNYRCSKDAARRLPGAGHAAAVRVVGGGLRRQRARSARSRSSSGRSTSTATRSCCSTTSCAAMLPTARAAQVAGFRYFNVYGPREQHKGRMASVAFHQFNQFRDDRQGQAVRRVRRLRPGRADARLRLRRRRGRGQPLVPRASRGERHLQPRHRPRAAVQRRRRWRSSTRARAGAASRRCRSTSWSRAGHRSSTSPFPRRWSASTSASHEADLDAPARRRLRPRVRRRRDRRRALRATGSPRHALSGGSTPRHGGRWSTRRRQRGTRAPSAASPSTATAAGSHVKKFSPRSLRCSPPPRFAAVDVNKADQAELEVDQGHRPGASPTQDPRRAQEGRRSRTGTTWSRASRASASAAPRSPTA